LGLLGICWKGSIKGLPIESIIIIIISVTELIAIKKRGIWETNKRFARVIFIIPTSNNDSKQLTFESKRPW